MGNMYQGRGQPHPISLRLAEIRKLNFGDRGRSRFARELGIPVTSYAHYETDRVPPAELLLAAARLTGTSLEWLVSGEGDRESHGLESHLTPARRLASEFLRLVERFPHLLPSAEEFVQLLASMSAPHHLPRSEKRLDSSELIPVIGSTAAGMAHFWHELEKPGEGPTVDAELEALLEDHFQRAGQQRGKATSTSAPTEEPIALVQFSSPDQQGFLEFLSAGDLKQRYPRAVAWRIDGESMSPRYLDGDLVITSPDYPAVEMQPCVARQKGQIGVNCKLFQTLGNDVLLIPVNEACARQRFPRNELQWAWRVLASVRLR